VFGFVTLDSIPYDPWFGRARETGAIAATEYDEGMFATALSAAAQRLPFLPTRAGLGSEVMRANPDLRTVRSPYEDGEELVAVPAQHLDVALVHLNRADTRGNAQYLGPDPYFDELFCLAAKKRFVSVEKVVDTAELTAGGPVQSLLLNRANVDGVVEAPRGAHFTTAIPDYGRGTTPPAPRTWTRGPASRTGSCPVTSAPICPKWTSSRRRRHECDPGRDRRRGGGRTVPR
jgi:glutaconate CoA-transferase subunit A